MKKRTMNRHNIINLLPNQFEKAFNKIITGEYRYRTHDNRLLDFRRGEERKLQTKMSTK